MGEMGYVQVVGPRSTCRRTIGARLRPPCRPLGNAMSVVHRRPTYANGFYLYVPQWRCWCHWPFCHSASCLIWSTWRWRSVNDVNCTQLKLSDITRRSDPLLKAVRLSGERHKERRAWNIRQGTSAVVLPCGERGDGIFRSTGMSASLP